MGFRQPLTFFKPFKPTFVVTKGLYVFALLFFSKLLQNWTTD